MTFIYVVFFIWLFDCRLEELTKLDLNELGDFLAGSFGPLAMCWLILGFFQQGIELRQNTSALKLQATQLENSVNKQSELIELTRVHYNVEQESLRHESEKNQPIFDVKLAGNPKKNDYPNPNPNRLSIGIKNVGEIATQVEFTTKCELEKQPEKIEIFKPSDKVEWCILEYKNKFENDVLTVSYVDITNVKGIKQYDIIPDENKDIQITEILSNSNGVNSFL